MKEKYPKIVFRVNQEMIAHFRELKEYEINEFFSRMTYALVYKKSNEKILYSKDPEQQMIADFIILDIASLLEPNKRNLEKNDIYTLECKSATYTCWEGKYQLKLFLPMTDYKERAKSLKEDTSRELYYQSNTESEKNWAYQNAQARVLIACNYKRKRLYVIKNWQELSLEAKRQYRNDLESWQMEKPWDRYLNSKDKDRDGNAYKFTHCIILLLEEMTNEFRKKYDIDIFDMEYKEID